MTGLGPALLPPPDDALFLRCILRGQYKLTQGERLLLLLLLYPVDVKKGARISR